MKSFDARTSKGDAALVATQRGRFARRLRAIIAASALVGAAGMIPVTPADAAGRPYIRTPTADVFWCTSVQDFCTSNTVTQGIPYKTELKMVCWRDDRRPFPNSSPRWFYAYLDNGQEGWLWSEQVGGQVSTPSCNTINWINVSDFAIGHLGTVQASTADLVLSLSLWPDWNGYWSGHCPKFTQLAWRPFGGHERAGTTGTAYDIYKNYAGNVGVPKSRPPRGALVFWGPTPGNPAGHIAISLGNWMGVGTTGLGPIHDPVAAYGIIDGSHPNYKGWVMPKAPTVPPNPS